MRDVIECYKLLDLEPGVSAEAILRSYMELNEVWNPNRYASNPVLRARAIQKWGEINEAYKTIRDFLPDLQDNKHDPQMLQKKVRRDFMELSRNLPEDWSKAILGILAAFLFVLMFVFARYILLKGRAGFMAPLG